MKTQLLVVSSGGGHWKQLMSFEAIYKDKNVIFITTENNPQFVKNFAMERVTDCNLRTPIKALRCMYQSFKIIKKYRPSVIISTGAAPGAFSIIWGKFFGAKTIWLDSLANVKKLSLSARISAPFTDELLTQWQHLAGKSIKYKGSII